MVQLEMIAHVRELAQADERIVSVLMYGSFMKGEGDIYSDIEFYLFCRADFDHREWVAGIRPVLLFFTNEHGTEVAIFDNLIRGEFHFAPAAERGIVRSWEGKTSFRHADNMVLVDKDGGLGEILSGIDRGTPPFDSPESVRWIGESLVNHLLMVRGLIERGEWVHAQQNFQYIQMHLLWLIRVEAGALGHWESPSKKAETDLPPEAYDAYVRCVPQAGEQSLRMCYGHALELSERLFNACHVPDDVRAVLHKIKTGW